MGNFARQGEDIIHDSQITKERTKKEFVFLPGHVEDVQQAVNCGM